MKGLGIGVGDVSAICLTHLDSDHFNPAWARRIAQQGIALFCHQDRTDELSRLGGGAAEFARLIRPFNAHPFSPVEGVHFTAIRLDHDEHGSHGFRIDGFGARIGYATDLAAQTANSSVNSAAPASWPSKAITIRKCKPTAIGPGF